MSRVKLSSPRIELAAIRGMLNSDSRITAPLYTGLDESYFSSDEARELFTYIKESSSKDGKVPKYRLLLDDPGLSRDARSFLRDSNAVLTTKQESKKAVHLLTKYRQTRYLASVVHTINDGLTEKRLDTLGLIDKVSDELAAARAVKADRDTVLHFGKNSNSLEMLEYLRDGERDEICLPTGLKTFDAVNMGLLRGSLVTIGGPSGEGKSHLGGSLLVSIAGFGYKATFTPLEMSLVEMACRVTANITKLDSMRIMQGRLTKEEKKLFDKRMYRWEKRTARLGGRYTIHKPQTDVSIEESYDAIEIYNPDVTLIDYISLLRERKGVDQWKQLGQDARYSKINAENRNRVNILLCQVNDEGKVKYARAVTEHSSNSWIFKADREQSTLQIEQVKSRNQNNFPFTVKINYATSTVTDMEGWEESTEPRDDAPNLTDLAQEV